MDTIMNWYIILLITGFLLFLLLRLIRSYIEKRNLKNEAKRRDMKLPHDFFEKAENFIKGVPEEMVEIRFLTYSFLGIEYKNKMVFKCKICGQVLHPQIGSDGRYTRDSWQCPNGCKLEKKSNSD